MKTVIHTARALLIALLTAFSTLAAHAAPLAFTGVNIAGGDFGQPKAGVASIYGTNYIYPTTQELDYFAGKGVNIIRFPFHWEDLQPAQRQLLDAAALARVQAVTDAATERGMIVILDPHNAARYYDDVVGGPKVSSRSFANFWWQMAARFKDNPRVWFGLMNEPHDMPPTQWLDAANAAIAAIRNAGAKNLILVPGISWTGAHSWVSSGNGTVMLGIRDPAHHYIFEVHQYLDADSSGTKTEVMSATIGGDRLEEFTAWCRIHHQRALLGEVGADGSPVAAQAMNDMLTRMEKNPSVWVGFTWWAAGAWWGDYMFTLEPKNGIDRPQMAYLRPHFQAKAVTKTR